MKYEDIKPFHPDEVPPPQSYVEIEAGTYLLEVTPVGSATPVISENITIGGLTYNTIAVVGNITDQPVEALHLIDETPGTISPVGALVRFTHTAPFADNAQDLLVDICVDGQIWMGLEDLPYKEFTETFMEVTQGEYDIAVTDAGSNCQSVFYTFPRLYFKTGQVADMFVIGDIAHQELDHATTTGLLYVKPTNAGNIRFGHFSQFAETSEASSVTIRIDGVDEITDFRFKETTGYMELDPGPHTIAVIPTGSVTPVATSNITIAEGEYYTSGVIGDNDDQPIEIYTLLDETDKPATGAKLRIVHAAPVAPALADTKVDICSMGALFEGLMNVQYKQYTDPYLLVDAGIFNLYVAAPDQTCANLLWSIYAFSLAEQGIGDLWILDRDSYCWDCGDVGGPPEVNLAHVAPYEDNSHLTAIRILVDNVPVIEDFFFLKFSGYMPMAPGTHYVKMIQESSDLVLATGWITLEADKYYTLHLIGNGDEQPTEVWLLEDEIDPIPDKAKIRIVNAAPISPILSETELDICNAENQLIHPNLTNIPYKGYDDPYVVYDPGFYRIKGAQSGTSCVQTVAGLYPYLFEAEDVATIYIFGDFTIPTGQIPYPDISAYMVFDNIMLKQVNLIP